MPRLSDKPTQSPPLQHPQSRAVGAPVLHQDTRAQTAAACQQYLAAEPGGQGRRMGQSPVELWPLFHLSVLVQSFHSARSYYYTISSPLLSSLL